jgi:hypothetical protein
MAKSLPQENVGHLLLFTAAHRKADRLYIGESRVHISRRHQKLAAGALK